VTPVLGETLHVGDCIVDPIDGCTTHVINRFEEYPGRCVGGHLRRAHGQRWDATISDKHTYKLADAALPAAA
jgi:hypothetical protein